MLRALLTCGLLAATASAAPVPKATKVDPGDPWKFPDLKSAGWVDLKDGLKVWDVKEGEGDEVTAEATVKVHYTGWLTDGKEFDSSKKRDLPQQFALKHLIAGWKAGMLGMKPGGIRRLYVPPGMGYGKNGAGGQIPPDATLVFVIELIDVKK